jgi:hypothetical protein
VLDFSHLAAYHIASVRRSIEALATFCGSLPETNPQKVALQRTCSCLKVHSEKRGQMGHKPYSTWSVRGRHVDHRFCGIGVRGISITFDHKWLKSSAVKLCEKSHERANLLAIKRLIAT